MSELYTILRERMRLSPMAALRWLHGPEPLPASRIPSHFMDERRKRLGIVRAVKSCANLALSIRDASKTAIAFEREMDRTGEAIRNAEKGAR